MIVFFLLIGILLIGLTAAAVMGRIGGFMADPTSTQAFSGVSGVGDGEGSLSAGDVGQLHFDRALRGYRMDEVDEVIDALSARVRELETEAASARGDGVSPEVSPHVSPEVAPDVSPEVAPADRRDTQEQ